MKRLTLSLAAVALVVAGTSSAVLARGTSSSHSFSGHRNFSSQGRYFSSHYYGRSYSGWSRYCWFPNYSCYGYYCPTQCCWYYWCGAQNCYLPVSYMNTFAPTAVNANQNTNVNTNVNVVGNTSPGLPVGATAVPVAPVGGAPQVVGPNVRMPGAP